MTIAVLYCIEILQYKILELSVRFIVLKKLCANKNINYVGILPRGKIQVEYQL
jgi:hypothetical protein